MGDDAMAFVRRSGIYFGLVIGVVQMFAWALFQNPWIMPAFGFGVGFISDYIALNMLFRPTSSRRSTSASSPSRACCTRSATRSPATTPGSWPRTCSPRDPLRRGAARPGRRTSCSALVGKEVSAAIDAQTGMAAPLVKMAVGTPRCNALKDNLVQMVLERLPTTLLESSGLRDERARSWRTRSSTRWDSSATRSTGVHPAAGVQGRRADHDRRGRRPRRCRRRTPGGAHRDFVRTSPATRRCASFCTSSRSSADGSVGGPSSDEQRTAHSGR